MCPPRVRSQAGMLRGRYASLILIPTEAVFYFPGCDGRLEPTICVSEYGVRFARFICFLVLCAISIGCNDRPPGRPFARVQLTTKFFAEGVAVGDINRDGIQDIVAGPYWYAGPDFRNASVIFVPVAFDPLKYSNDFLTFVYDFNGDGWPDVLVINFPGLDASWFENPRGASTFWIKHQIIDQVDGESPAFVDIDGDGTPELVYISNGRLGWATPNAADPTQPWIFHPISPNFGYDRFRHGMGVGDINGDGRLDILEANGWWEQPPDLHNDPVWTFHPVPFGPGAQFYAVDLDGDGLADVVTSVAHEYGLAWFQQMRQNGQISFCKHVIMGDPGNPNRYGVVFSELHAVAVVDMDGDGIPDIVTGKRHWAHGPTGDVDPNGPSVLYWFKTVRTSQGVDFVPYLIDSNSGVGTQIFVGDVNGDGRPDVVVSNKLGTVYFQRSLPNTVTPTPLYPLNSSCQP